MFWISLMLFLPGRISTSVQTRYECGDHGRFEYCIEGIPGCVIGCHCHPGYYFDTDTKICEPNSKLVSEYRRLINKNDPTRMPDVIFPSVESTPTPESAVVDVQAENIAKESDDLGDWLYDQFFKTIENSIINNTNSGILTRRSGNLKIPKTKKRASKQTKSAKISKKNKENMRRKLLRITEDDSLFESSGSSEESSASDDSDSSDSSNSEVSQESKSADRKESSHGHKRILMINKKPKSPLPSFIFLPQLHSQFFPSIAMPMFPMVPVPPIAPMAPMPPMIPVRPGAFMPSCPTAAPPPKPVEPNSTRIQSNNSTVQNEDKKANEGSNTDERKNTDKETMKDEKTNVEDVNKANAAKKEEERKNMNDGTNTVENNKTDEGKNTENVKQAENEKKDEAIRMLKRARKKKLLRQLQKSMKRLTESEHPIDPDLDSSMFSPTDPNGQIPSPTSGGVDFQYLEQLIHKDTHLPKKGKPVFAPRNHHDMHKIPFKPQKTPLISQKRPLIPPNFSFNPSPSVTKFSPKNKSPAEKPSRRSGDEKVYNVPISYAPAHVISNNNRIFETPNEAFYSNMGQRIADIIRKIDMSGKESVDLEIERSVTQTPTFFIEDFVPRSYWERSVRSLLNQYSPYLEDSYGQRPYDNLFNLEEKVETLATTTKPYSLDELENYLVLMHKTVLKIQETTQAPESIRKRTETGNFNMNLLSRQHPKFENSYHGNISEYYNRLVKDKDKSVKNIFEHFTLNNNKNSKLDPLKVSKDISHKNLEVSKHFESLRNIVKNNLSGKDKSVDNHPKPLNIKIIKKLKLNKIDLPLNMYYGLKHMEAQNASLYTLNSSSTMLLKTGKRFNPYRSFSSIPKQQENIMGKFQMNAAPTAGKRPQLRLAPEIANEIFHINNDANHKFHQHPVQIQINFTPNHNKEEYQSPSTYAQRSPGQPKQIKMSQFQRNSAVFEPHLLFDSNFFK